MAGYAGWYVGRIMTSGVASAKGGTSPEIQDTVFQWTDANNAPTVNSVNITDLTAITGGPYPTKAAAVQAAASDPNTTSGLPGTNPKPPVTTSTVNSAAGRIHLPNLTGWTHNIEQWLIRGFEMLLGLGLIIVSVAKLASDTPIGKAAVKAGKAAAIL